MTLTVGVEDSVSKREEMDLVSGAVIGHRRTFVSFIYLLLLHACSYSSLSHNPLDNSQHIEETTYKRQYQAMPINRFVVSRALKPFAAQKAESKC